MNYTVNIKNGNGDTKVVAQCYYKRDAIRIAQRFVNAMVARKGKQVYSHSHNVKAHASKFFTLAGAKGAKAPAPRQQAAARPAQRPGW